MDVSLNLQQVIAYQTNPHNFFQERCENDWEA